MKGKNDYVYDSLTLSGLESLHLLKGGAYAVVFRFRCKANFCSN